MKIIIFNLIAGIVLSGAPLMVQANNERFLVAREDASQNAPVFALEDAKDIKDLPGRAKTLSSVKEGAAPKEAKAKIKLFKTENSSGKNEKQAGEVFAESFSEAVAASAIPDPVGTGVIWLKNNQNSQGGWGGGAEIVETAAVVSLLKRAEGATSSPEYQKAIDWFDSTYPENSDYLAEKAISLAGAGRDIDSLAGFLASQINEEDHGFGYQKGYQSDNISASKVLEALYSSNYQDSGDDSVYTLKAILFYLLSSQNSDGGWSKTRGEQSDIKITTLVLEAFKPYQTYVLAGTPQGDIVIQDKIDLGINYLKGCQNPDGGWQDIEGTAKAYDVLLNYEQYPDYNREALNYLISNQSPDGSFAEQNVYVTAKALKAIAKPDIAVADIQNISAAMPNKSNAVKIVIANLGYHKSEPINFRDEPRAFHLFVDGKETGIEYESEYPGKIILDANAQLNLDVILENLAFGPHAIDFSVDYDGVEFDKTNNQKSVELIFDDPGFIGPEPPSWVGASTGQSPNKIAIRWQHSADPAKTHYYLFLGSSPDNYTQYFDIGGAYNAVAFSGFPHDVPYYFSVVSVDANNVRGDYSMETSARAYNDPDNYLGTIPLSPRDDNQVLLYGVDFRFFGVGGVNSGDYNPIFITAYPGYYYVTATKTGCENAVQKIEIKPNETGELAEFILNIIDDGLISAPIQNFRRGPETGESFQNILAR